MKPSHLLHLSTMTLLIFGYILIALNSYFVFEAFRYVAYPNSLPWGGQGKFLLLSSFIALYSLGSTIFAPFFGGLSDQIGRRKVFLISLAIWALGYFIGAFGAGFKSIDILFVGHFICGAGDSFRTLAFSSLADRYPQSYERMKSFGRFSSTDGILAGTFYMLDFSLRHPEIQLARYPSVSFLRTAAIGVLVWVIFYLNAIDRRIFKEKNSLISSFQGYGKTFKEKGILRLFLLFFLAVFPFLTLEEIHGPYLLKSGEATRFDVLILYVIMGISWFLTSCFLFPLLTKKVSIGRIFYFTFVIYFLYWGIAPILSRSLFLYSIPIFTGVALGLFWPSILGMVSLITSPDRQGKAQAVCYSLLTLSALIGPAIFRYNFLAEPIPFYFLVLIATGLGAFISYSLRDRLPKF